MSWSDIKTEKLETLALFSSKQNTIAETQEDSNADKIMDAEEQEQNLAQS